ncbi:MAG: hypothetical protein GXY47_00550 [Acidobacteria bacterium]|nr:hypothetical protein [Acidobacteriota bacterium]
MRRLLSIAAVTAFSVVAVHAPSGSLAAQQTPETEYEVLSPWADVDPIPLRGLSPRLDTLDGKKIGLFANFKRAAKPITDEVERRLKQKYPTIQTSLFHSTLPNVTETETINKERFAAWAKDMDAVVAAVGD